MKDKKKKSASHVMDEKRTSHGTDQQDPPPAYAESVTTIRSTTTSSTVISRSSQSVKRLLAKRKPDPKPKKAWFQKLADRLNEKIQNWDPPKQWDLDCREKMYPRLKQLVKSTVDPTHLLRNILFYVLLESFRGNAKMYTLPADRTTTFNVHGVQESRTAFGSGKFFRWDFLEITHDICNLVRDLIYKMEKNRLSKVLQAKKDLFVYFVLKPAEDLQIQADYALEILGSFKERRQGDQWRISTLIGHWKPRNEEQRRDPYRMVNFGDTVASHASFIASLHLPKERQRALEKSMARYLKHFRLDNVQMSNVLKQTVLNEQKHRPGETCCWPMRDGYMDLFRLLGKPDHSSWRHNLQRRDIMMKQGEGFEN